MTTDFTSSISTVVFPKTYVLSWCQNARLHFGWGVTIHRTAPGNTGPHRTAPGPYRAGN